MKGTEIYISVVTVCRNAERELHQTIESVLQQERCAFEYLIMDGQSEDGTLAVVESYRKAFDEKGVPLKVCSGRDSGVYDAMNKAAKLATGQWIIFMNAGDSFFSSDVLSQFCRLELNPSVGVCYGDTMERYDFGQGVCKPAYIEKAAPLMPFCHQSAFTRLSLQQRYGFDLKYKIAADLDFFCRLHEAGVKFMYWPTTIASFDGQDGISLSSPLRLRLEKLQIYHVDRCRNYPFIKFKTYLQYGCVGWMKRFLPKPWTDALRKRNRPWVH